MIESDYMTKKKRVFLFAVLMGVVPGLCGCVHHITEKDMRPTNIPGKVIVSAPALMDASENQILRENSPWDYCEKQIVSDELEVSSAAELTPTEFRERVLTRHQIQAEMADQTIITWRCMAGAVFTCNSSAYPQCGDKVDFSREPSEAMRQVCENADFDGLTLPSAVTGRNTAFEWICKDGEAVITQQAVEADGAGYNAAIWLEIPRP